MDPVVIHYLDSNNKRTIDRLLGDIANGGPPVEIWKNGVKVAVAIHPEEFDLLNRLIAQEPN